MTKFSFELLDMQRTSRDEIMKSQAFREYNESVTRACAIALYHSLFIADANVQSRIDDGDVTLKGMEICRAGIYRFEKEGDILLVDGYSKNGYSLSNLIAPLSVIEEYDSKTPEDVPCPQTIDDPVITPLNMTID